MPRLVLAAFVLASLGTAVAALRPAQAMPTPTQEHAQLLKAVGEWEGTLTMSAPGVPAEPMACRETVTGVGAFWTVATFTCDFGGMPFIGSGTMGYDTERKLYVGTWIDAMTTRLTVM